MDTVDSYEISNQSSTILSAAAEPTDNTESSAVRPPELSPVDVSALQLLSINLESLFDSPEAFYGDAKLILADEREVSFHRFIVAARSPFFKNALAAAAEKDPQKSSTAGTKLELKNIAMDYEVGFDSVAAVMAYVYSGRVRPPPKGVSDCADEDCRHVSCRPALDFMVEVLYVAFVFQIPELVTMYQRHLVDVVDKVIIEDALVILKLANICGQACKKLFDKCTEIIVKSNVDTVTLNKSLPQQIVKQVIDIRKELGLEVPEPNKHVSNIHKALECEDLALVDLLLKEGYTNLDEAYALHFAVAYCAVETATELLKREVADVNRRNLRGYTVLHVAAMRKEPSLIAFLLTKGANASDMALDGRTALLIAKQVTKAGEYNCITEEGKDSPKGRLCVEILEQPENLGRFPEDASSACLALAPDNELKIRLIDFENRVQMARCLFPTEAQLAMELAPMKGTSEFTVDSQELDGTGAKRSAPDQYMVPFVFEEKHRSRLEALSKTVEFGRRFFPRCSTLLDKIADCETLSILAFVEKETPENRLEKRQKYMEIQESLLMAFNEDNEERGKSSRSGSSSSTSKSTKRSNESLSIVGSVICIRAAAEGLQESKILEEMFKAPCIQNLVKDQVKWFFGLQPSPSQEGSRVSPRTSTSILTNPWKVGIHDKVLSPFGYWLWNVPLLKQISPQKMSNNHKDNFSLAGLTASLKDEDRAGLLNAHKNKLAGHSSDMLENLTALVRARVDALKDIQSQHDELEAKFREERAVLEAKYEKLYHPLYAKRYEIVNGTTEIELTPEDTKMDEVDDKTAEEKGVPSFWLTALQNNEVTSEEVTEHDEEALKYLKDIKWCKTEEPKGFKLEFLFDSNPFFINNVLTKSYLVIDEDEPLIEKAIGTEID
ncbi:hypothetical protein IGI04_031586 [Brassica rapa subsp. trilocularis]|uniref:Uncharacterized protein n=1 Tax=Brassica rapa subsp. trilocularis TaxID=1813537 RepID=A0ABQ7LU13_BRACM|nr:hypothetical protein IGI04_031586 [Brassica rapa subsp. trilocularis]